jgi:hypothetical protein
LPAAAAAEFVQKLKSLAFISPGLHNWGMASMSPQGRYRVRLQVEREQSVPQQIPAPRFASRDDAETFAHLVAKDRHQSVVVEKLAPAGCWLQLSTIAGLAA